MKILWLLRRKPGISFEQFRDHYERSHAELGKRYFGHLLTSYRRNYNDRRIDATTPAGVAGLMAAKQWDYDCVTEWELPNEEALAEVIRLLADPAIGQIFYDDEEHFLDRSSVRLVRCDTRESGIAIDAPAA